ncbi:YdcF family protein [Roseomonas sp. NAR14]|uniref:YdcF family protein n=1 Tax=Roseomonas acroporae TaxID=2937791 RepID=A0A9X2BXJ1_9PROT|nr:YdcF family protein [Roseomonas acroporae]
MTAPDTVIVVFGAAIRPDGTASPTLRRRIEAAAAYGARQVSPLYCVTGGQGRYGPPEAEVMAALLRDHGVPEAAILQERTGLDTLSSAIACTHLLRGMGHAGPVRVATSFYHLPRCVLLLRLAGLRARPVPPPATPAGMSRWGMWYWRLREVPAIPYDALLMLWARLRGRV